MQFNEIGIRKPIFPIGDRLRDYLDRNDRCADTPIGYPDLLRHDGLMAHKDAQGHETLWTSVILRPSEIADTHERLIELYQMLVSDGRHVDHLRVASVDFCAYGNSQPFRIKIFNQLNDNHDYYYIKRADASRVYGLELEHLLSPNRINYMVSGQTLVEEHIIGVPGDELMNDPTRFGGHLDPVRISKEFVKFNERCFARLLGDMRAYNFVVDVIQDFDRVQYRIRSIDFDQQSYEGRSRIYLPQFYKENLPYVRTAQERLTPETAGQYAGEERAVLRKRYRLAHQQIEDLLSVMEHDRIAPEEHVTQLARDLAEHHRASSLPTDKGMGGVLREHLGLHLQL